LKLVPPLVDTASEPLQTPSGEVCWERSSSAVEREHRIGEVPFVTVADAWDTHGTSTAGHTPFCRVLVRWCSSAAEGVLMR